ncbi:PREDICTED: actin-like protein 9 [Merops nubicus]|uniref:actin-like protein 9 n=1 Tax=Merops nubicus TaxID=57421 RepID=UPI0004F03A9A|nr:PREDICTED: actin-like protein 9 [Merops nubicus]
MPRGRGRAGANTTTNTPRSSSGEGLQPRTGAVVIDMGTRSCRAGFSGQQTPIAEINTLVSCPVAQPIGTEDRSKAVVGEEAHPNTEVLDPMQNGIIANWEAARTLWQHVFDHELRVPPEEYPLLITEPLLSPTTHREKMVEVVFESLGSLGFFVAQQPVLSTYAYGRMSGLVVDMGYATSHAVPVHEGYSLAYATERIELAGSHLSWYLLTLLGDTGCVLNNEVVRMAEDIKHKCCYVASNFESECQLPSASCALDFPLPDGQTITLSKERFQCPEILFKPLPNWDISNVGIHEMTRRSLDRLPEDIRSTMCKNILLCGGSSLFMGLEKRFCSELLQILPPNTDVRVEAVPLRRHSAWTGGSILSSLKNFQTWWIRRDEYEEEGPRIVHQRCY